MKKIIIFLFIILSFTFTGCMKKYQLDEEQTDMVAEYMAGLLLMSNDDYIGRLSRTDSGLKLMSKSRVKRRTKGRRFNKQVKG